MQYIDGKDLYSMFNFGTYYIMKQRSYLNDINVFPVPDGDTGNNLLHTMKTISLESSPTKSFRDTLESISSSALVGARGNSGVIFAQFVNGLYKSNSFDTEISFKQFSRLVEKSVVHTYASLSNPVEGTMLTIIKKWSSILKSLEETDISIKDKFNKSYEEINLYLEKTKDMLGVLKEKDVVDSGALGFTLFIKGIVGYYNNEKIEELDLEKIEEIDHHDFDGDAKFRYCTEALVKKNGELNNKLKKELTVYGDSIVIADGKSKFRIHIHTNTPEKVFQHLNKYGKIESAKVDDMQLDISLKNSKSKRVLVTDSIADISPSILADNNVVVIPVNIIVDQVSYLDKRGISNEVLFDLIEKSSEYPKSATPSIKYINDLFSRLLLNFTEIIIITVSKKLSSTYRVIFQEAKKLQQKGKNITVIDSKNNSGSEGLLLLSAINLMKENVSTKDIIRIIKEEREKTEILVCLKTFKYATLSGRVPKKIGKFAVKIGLRPIMTLKNGNGAAFSFAFSKKKITKKIVKYVKKDMKKNKIKSYAIVHCLAEAEASEYKEIFTSIIGFPPAYICPISSATAIHSGKGTVAIAYIKS